MDAPNSPEHEPDSPRRPRVAVVDDEPDARLLFRRLLEERYDVRVYRDGVDALDGFLTEPPDVALVDVQMPRLDGPGLLAAVRADPALAALPVVALTASAMSGDREALLRSGFDGYVSKPVIDEEILFREIERLRGRSGR